MWRYAIIVWAGIAAQALAYGAYLIARTWLVTDKQALWLGEAMPVFLALAFLLGAGVADGLLGRPAAKPAPPESRP